MRRAAGRLAPLGSVVLAVLLPAVAAAQHRHEEPGPGAPPSDLGEIHFASSGAPSAQPSFLRGLLLLHSFEFQDAAREFRQAQAEDPGFALAYWGEAMAYNHPIWGEQDKAAARQVLSRLGATTDERLAKAPTEREKAYLRASEALYGDGEKRERDAAYSEVMLRIAQAYPDDLDARALYALSLLGLTGTKRDLGNYMRAAAVAEEVYEINPSHPGALHYLIHAYDDPLHAPLGLRAARRYGRVAPAASHAQHMPSHIFFALGMWEDSITANQASMKTARDRGAGGYHPLHWLEYAYLQEGRREDAGRLVSVIEADVAKEPTPSARTHLAAARATWLVETRGAGDPSYRKPVDRSGITALSGFTDHAFARGLAALETGDRPAAAAALVELQEMIRGGRPAVSAEAGATRITQVLASELEAAEVMEHELTAALRFAEGRTDVALEHARAAAALEDKGVFEYGPPPSPKPPHELLGELFARMQRHAEARVEFEKALQRTPKRSLALLGLARAAALSGDRATALSVRAELVAQWKSEAFPVPPLP